MKALLQITLICLILTSCSHYVCPPPVKIRYEYVYNYKPKLLKSWETSTWRKDKKPVEYIKYDQNGNEIEIGEYGEIWHFQETKQNSDSTVSIISGHGTYPKKLNTVTFKTYNDSNQILTEEVWRYHDNQKDYLVYKTDFKYSNGILVNEIEYDSEGEITREKSYDIENNVETENRKKTIYEPFVRIGGNSKDSTRYDSIGRPVENYNYYKGKFIRRTVWDYNDQDDIVTTYKYDDHPDSLWSYTEIRYDYLTNQPARKYWKVLNSRTETKDIYIYNRKKLLKKVLHYGVDLQGRDELQYYKKYKYELY